MKLNQKKCHLFQKEVTFLGHTISEIGIGTSPNKIETIKNWPTPRTTKQTKSFISLASYYRSYVYQFATIAKPIHQLAENERDFNWTEDCEQSFQMIKEALCSAPLLLFPPKQIHSLSTAMLQGLGKGPSYLRFKMVRKMLLVTSVDASVELRETIVSPVGNY